MLKIYIFLFVAAAFCDGRPQNPNLSGPPCRNKYSNCERYKYLCSWSNFAEFCPVTCGKCKELKPHEIPSYVLKGSGLARFQITKEQRTVIRDSCLAAHNTRRALHVNTPPLKYNDNLADRAQWYAEHLEIKDLWDHDPWMSFGYGSTHIGENLYKMSFDLRKHRWDAAVMAQQTEVAIKLWYDEIRNYNFATGQKIDKKGVVIGHFTQLVWDTTTEVGCGVVTGPSGTFVVARYGPGGNISGHYTKHVHIPKIKSHSNIA